MTGPDLLRADWPAPPGVHALVTCRAGGVSREPFAGFNLGAHVGDDPEAVRHNRAALAARLAAEQAAGPVQWLDQRHGSDVHVAVSEAREVPSADASYTRVAGLPLGVLTADCLPVCIADAAGREVAVAHAGWRGLAAGVLENSLARFAAPAAQLRAWLGPAIGPCHFEVGDEVREVFLAHEQRGGESESAFTPSGASGKWMADLYALARQRLRAAGLREIYGGGLCTYCDAARFFSYRRDGRTGRFATVILRTAR